MYLLIDNMVFHHERIAKIDNKKIYFRMYLKHSRIRLHKGFLSPLKAFGCLIKAPILQADRVKTSAQ